MISSTDLTLIKVFVPAIFSFAAGLLFAPAWLSILYKNKMWKKSSKEKTVDGREATVFNQLHASKEVGTPRMGGVVIWSSTIAIALILWSLAQVVPDSQLLSQFDFISRSQTWIPLFTLLLGATIGLIDDYFEIKGNKHYAIGGLSLRSRLLFVSLIGSLVGWWFLNKLEYTDLYFPFAGDIYFGFLIVPFVTFIMLAIYSSGVIDGIDGLSGGVFSTVFASYGLIALLQNQLNIATLCFVITGSILAFLWFNLPPAKYYMTETGTMALTMCLTVVIFLTDQVFLFPIIAMPLAVTPLSNIIQLGYRRFTGKKLFRITPIHHHFEAIGVPPYQVAMKYWIVSVVCALAGVVLAIIG